MIPDHIKTGVLLLLELWTLGIKAGWLFIVTIFTRDKNCGPLLIRANKLERRADEIEKEFEQLKKQYP